MMMTGEHIVAAWAPLQIEACGRSVSSLIYMMVSGMTNYCRFLVPGLFGRALDGAVVFNGR